MEPRSRASSVATSTDHTDQAKGESPAPKLAPAPESDNTSVLAEGVPPEKERHSKIIILLLKNALVSENKKIILEGCSSMADVKAQIINQMGLFIGADEGLVVKLKANEKPVEDISELGQKAKVYVSTCKL